MKKKILRLLKYMSYVYTGLSAIIVLFFLALYIEHQLYQPLDNEKLKDLFGQDHVEIKLECKHDFFDNGFFIMLISAFYGHNDLYEYYEYSIDPENMQSFIQSSTLYEYPKFQNDMYISDKLANKEYSRWKKTPLTSTVDSLNYNFCEYGNSIEFPCSKKFIEEKYIDKTGNYYAYFSAYPVGNFFYILVPSENKLYLVLKRD